MKSKFASGDAIEESSSGDGGIMSNKKKSCAICGTSKTPLWRSGPAGPKVRLSVNRSDINQFWGYLDRSDLISLVGFCSRCVTHAGSETGRKDER